MSNKLSEATRLAEENKRLRLKLENAVRDIRRAFDAECPCELCKYNIPCKGKECDCYIEGRGLVDEKTGQKFDQAWTCKDFNFGTCDKLAGTPCETCDFKNNWKWKESDD